MPIAQKQEIGQPLPSFTLPLLDASEKRSPEFFLQGKRGAVIAFWSGVCAHCIRYDAYFNDFTRRYPELGFAAVASRHSETLLQMTSAVKDRRLTFPILFDQTGAVARLWYSQQTPRCYLLSPDMNLMYVGAVDNFRFPGESDYKEWLEHAITSFLAGKPIARAQTASFGCAIETAYYKIPSQL